MSTPRFGITTMASTQQDRAATVNEAFAKLEGGAGFFVAEEVGLDTPPVSPNEGDVYIVGDDPTGEWEERAQSPAMFYNGSWRYFLIRQGFFAYSVMADALYRYDGVAWSEFATGGVSTDDNEILDAVVTAETGGNLDLSAPGSSIGGKTLTNSGVDDFLANDQDDPTENGVYVWNGAASPATRRADADTGGEFLTGMLVPVDEGDHGGTEFRLVTAEPITLGTTAIHFARLSGTGQFSWKQVSTFPYDLISADRYKDILINNGASDVVVNVGNVMGNGNEVNFRVTGTGSLTLVEDGITIRSPWGLVLDSRYAKINLKKKSSSIFYLTGENFIDTDDTLAADSDTLVPSQKAIKAYVDAVAGGSGFVVGPGSSTAGDIPTFADTGGALLSDSGKSFSTDGTLAANSDDLIPTQKAVKTYADQLIAAADAMIFKGVQDCSANPNYPAADRGWTYRVSVAGKIGGASGTNVEAGDLFICLDDGTASGTQAAQGSHWTIAQANLDGAVIGPASVTDSHVALFDGTTGKLIKDGGALPSALSLASTTEQLTGTDSAKATTADSVAALWEKGADTASAGTMAFGEGGFFHVTGTATINDIDFTTAKDGRTVDVIFDSTCTLTHNGTTLQCPGGVSINTQVGDRARVVQDSGDNIIILFYFKADGTPLVNPANMLKSNTSANLTAGYTTTADNLGNLSGTVTPDPANGQFQRGVNHGAITLNPPSVGTGDSTNVVLQLTNDATAGAIDTSAFTKVAGDALTTTNGDDFMLDMTVVNGFKRLIVTALQ